MTIAIGVTLLRFNCYTQERCLERLFTLQVSKTGDKLSPGALSDSLQVDLFASPDGHGSGLDEVFKAEVVNAAGGENDVGAGVQDLHDALFGDVGLAVADLLKLLWVGDKDLEEKKKLILDCSNKIFAVTKFHIQFSVNNQGALRLLYAI